MEEYLKPIHESQSCIAAKNQMQHSVTKLMLNPLLLRSKWRLSPKGRTLILLVLGESSEMLLSECHEQHILKDGLAHKETRHL